MQPAIQYSLIGIVVNEHTANVRKRQASKLHADNDPSLASGPSRRAGRAEQAELELSSRFYEAFISKRPSLLNEQQPDRRNAIALIQNIATDIGQLAQRSAERVGIHVSDFYVLLLLENNTSSPPSQVADLQKALGFTAGGMSRRLDRMEEAGLVKRIRDPKDARAWLAKLTRKGQMLATRIRSQRSPQLEAAYAELSQQEWAELAKLLRRLNVAMQPLAEDL
ncbi:MarR family winged helix-turn-helix transcriptional regulator [Pseudomonas bharatica]|uniref:MarR family winged helix-turn-helix transcriptional regulator n=1 Tax=Pseudomonas bharatica TaxID=2692112 RepID=UPI003B27DBAA